jgi:predicted RecA/RadA family phage recombinase
LNGSSTTPIEVSINQGGVIVPLKAPVDVKSGDHVMVSTSIAVSAQNPRGVKCYINKVVFMGPGEEIVMGSSVSTAEMMAKAKEQGMNVTGFSGGVAPQQGFGMGQPAPFPGNGSQTGFAPPPVQPPQQGGGFAPPGGFNAPSGFPPRQ